MGPRQPAMRRSCHFCRTRKIRCSGQSICSECQKRSFECVYDLEASKGRPKGSNSRSPTQIVVPSRAPFVNKRTPVLSAPRSNSVVSLDGSLSTNVDPGASVAAELEVMFQEIFVEPLNAPKTNKYQERLAAFYQKMRSTDGSQSPSPAIHSRLSYRGLLSLVTQDIVETLVTRFGSLGCQPFRPDDGNRFFIQNLIQDQTQSMISTETVVTLNNPLTDYDSHQTTQLIDVWFAVHPLSALVSKTLFLRVFRCNTHDEILLAIMLADAHFVSDDLQSHARAQALLDWAAARLQDLPVKKAGISTAQALFLLGWHHLCLSRVRRATCYIGYAGRLMMRFMMREAPQTCSSRINGIAVGRVEEEVIRNLWWMTFSLTLWACIQMDLAFSDFLSTAVLHAFPPMDQSTSVLMKLDYAAGNYSTLRQQSLAIREVWLLSHITSTAAHLYATHTQQLPEVGAIAVSRSSSLQDSLPQHLQSLQGYRPTIVSLCADARDILLRIVSVVRSKVEDRISQVLMLAVYHTMLIHFLFPRPENMPVEVTETLMQNFTQSAKALLDLLPIAKDGSQGAGPIVAEFPSATFPHAYLLALDACSRGMDYFCRRAQCYSSEAEGRLLIERLPKIYELARTMHQLFQEDLLLQDRRWRSIKKHLKIVCGRLEKLMWGISIRDDFLAYNVSSAPSNGHSATPAALNARPFPNSTTMNSNPLHSFEGAFLDQGTPFTHQFIPGELFPSTDLQPPPPDLLGGGQLGSRSNSSVSETSSGATPFTETNPSAYSSNHQEPKRRRISVDDAIASNDINGETTCNVLPWPGYATNCPNFLNWSFPITMSPDSNYNNSEVESYLPERVKRGCNHDDPIHDFFFQVPIAFGPS